MTAKFTGRVSIVTGGGSGIGRATALAFGAEGSKVVVADIVPEMGQETVRLIKEKGGEATFVKADVSRSEDVAELVSKTVRTYGRLDFAFNNAGIEGALATVADYPEEAWNKVLSINLTGVFLCMKHEIPAMLKAGGGAIVNTASILGLVSFATSAAYTSAKHGVIGLTKTAALEYATQGIRVNAVCPGFIETPMVMDRGLVAAKNKDVYDQIANAHPVKRLGKPEEIAQAVLWLCSDQASFVTGIALPVDGAYTAQ
jgi:NAD(P)-dependent dehydrogenase (short-subunit alcohol dehydrogenase family)